MSQIIILYGTLTGNTQLVAEYLAADIKKLSKTSYINCLNVADAPDNIFDNLTSADLILIGCSTWDDGNYPIDMANFLSKYQNSPPSIAQVNFGVFGCGDSSYGNNFCLAVTKLSQTFKKWGGQELLAGLKVDGYPEMPETILATNLWLEKIKLWLEQN